MFEKVVVVDAKGHLLGRLAAAVAKELLCGQKIVVVRCEELLITGRFLRNKIKFKHFLNKRRNTNPKRGPFHYRAPHMIFWRTVRGMLPHKLVKGAHALERLQSFVGLPAPWDSMKRQVVPSALAAFRLKPGRKVTVLKDLSGEVGWKHKDIVEKLEAKRKVVAQAWFKRQKALYKLRDQAVKNVESNIKTHNDELKKIGYLV
eukprot:TRINITY_DN183_c0_g1_i5.p1 TRINITY_DN183_c0_g1~~TRINITY_DN183_c0_g1_i5.p1  ORF type:complete len:203 (-),score=36.71 TRINITY_DN183_c0_g1_i5:107-715(-)